MGFSKRTLNHAVKNYESMQRKCFASACVVATPKLCLDREEGGNGFTFQANDQLLQ